MPYAAASVLSWQFLGHTPLHIPGHSLSCLFTPTIGSIEVVGGLNGFRDRPNRLSRFSLRRENSQLYGGGLIQMGIWLPISLRCFPFLFPSILDNIARIGFPADFSTLLEFRHINFAYFIKGLFQLRRPEGFLSARF